MTQVKLLSSSTLADMLDKDPNIEAFAEEVLLAPETSSRAPAEMVIFLRNDYTPDQLRSFADPNSSQKDGKDGQGRKVGDNALPGVIWDKYTVESSGEEIKKVWYSDYAGRTKVGKHLNNMRDIAKRVLAGEKNMECTTITLSGDTVDLMFLPESEQQAYKTQLDARFTRYCNLFRKAIDVHRMWEEIEARYPESAEPDWVLADPEKPELGLSKTIKPIRLWAVHNGKRTGASRSLSVNDFLRLDIDEAISKGHTFITLVNSEKKSAQAGTGKGKASDKQAVESAVTTANVLTVASNLQQYFGDQSRKSAFLHAFAKMKGEERDQTLLTFGLLAREINAFLGPHTARFEAVEEAELDKLNKEIAEQAARKSA